jgi:hypothetical protein
MPVLPLNKRSQRRYRAKARFEGSELPVLSGSKKAGDLHGKVADISEGGFCIVAATVPARSALLQGRLRFAKVPTQIPTLVQVRWSKKAPGRQYMIGLQYVL